MEMVNRFPWLKRLIADFNLVCIVGLLSIVLGQWYVNNFTKWSEFVKPYVEGPAIYKVGDKLTIKYDVVRYKDCVLEISRLFKRPDGREIQLQKVTQLVKAGENPPTYMKDQSFTVPLVPEVLNEGEQEVEGLVFPRVQRLCNWLDNFQRRIEDMQAVKVKVTR